MAIEDVLNKINKQFPGTASFGALPERQRIPFSSPYLNYVTYGGVVMGRSSEFVGAESSGKSTLVLDVIKNFQKMESERIAKRRIELEELIPSSKGKNETALLAELSALKERTTVYLDIEYTLDSQWSKKLGVDMDKVIILHPDLMGIEEPLDWIVDLAETGDVGLICIDSVGAMISGAEEEKGIGEATYGGIAKPLTRFYKKIAPHLSKYNIALIMVNQIRDDLVNQYNKFNRPGGRMHKFAQSLTLGLSAGEKLDEKYGSASNNSEMVYARMTNVFVIKNKTAPPDRQRANFCIRYGVGLDSTFDTFNMACDMGLISANGAYYSFFDDNGELVQKIQGKANAIKYLEANKEVHEGIWKALYEKSLDGKEDEND